MPKKKTKEEFIKDAREKHGDKYDYSKVEYMNNYTKVCIICPEHGEFWQGPKDHAKGQGCPKCNGKYAPTIEEWIVSARKVHGNKYDYSNVKYVNYETKVCIICPEHGEFWQTPNNHLSGKGCYKCSGCYVPTTEEWIVSARKIHGDKYDYSKVKYVNNATKVCIICKEHGEFWQKPNNHNNGQGCPKCGFEKNCENKTLTKEEFIKKAKEVHYNKYEYTKVNYISTQTKVCIICPEHGEFWQTPNSHTQGHGCPKCRNEATGERCRLSKEDFIKKANEIHHGRYDYHKVKYKNNSTKVCITCPEHGEFWQKPNSHLSDQGCPKCNLSHLERSMMHYLDEHSITYDYQKRFDWLGLQSLDFYLPDYNVGIECQGIQHFKPIERFGGENSFIECQKRDKKKKKLCEKHGVKLLYYGNTPNYDTFLGEAVHDDVQYLIDYLKNNK